MIAPEKQRALWDAQLEQHGRVDFPLTRRALLPWFIFFSAFTALGIFVAATVWLVVGLVCTALFFVFVASIAVALVRKSPVVLVVDREGLTRTSPEPAVHRSWADVVDASVEHASFRNEVIDVESRSPEGATEHLQVAAGIQADRATVASWMVQLAQRAQVGEPG